MRCMGEAKDNRPEGLQDVHACTSCKSIVDCSNAGGRCPHDIQRSSDLALHGDMKGPRWCVASESQQLARWPGRDAAVAGTAGHDYHCIGG